MIKSKSGRKPIGDNVTKITYDDKLKAKLESFRVKNKLTSLAAAARVALCEKFGVK